MADAITRVFIHGLDSSSRGTKGSFFSRNYPGMIAKDYAGSLEQRMAKLTEDLAGKTNIILVGSSFGGLMAALFTCTHSDRVRKLILLAPALEHGDFRPFYGTALQLPVILYHGTHDVGCLPEPTLAIARRLFANLESHLVDDDHDLHRVFPTLSWDRLLDIEAP
jgi:homoserine acetyltransferase